MTFSRTSYSPISTNRFEQKVTNNNDRVFSVDRRGQCSIAVSISRPARKHKASIVYIHTIEPTTFILTNTATRNLSLRIIRIVNCARYLVNSREIYRLVGGTRTWRAHGVISSVGGWPRTPFLPFDSFASLSLDRMRTKRKLIQTADNEFSSTKRVSNNDFSWKVNGPSILLLLQSKLEHFSAYSYRTLRIMYRK